MQIDKSSKLGRFLGHVLPGVIKPIHILWNEVIGFLFLCLACIPVPSIIRYWRQGDISKLGFGLLFAGVMLYFGINSFWRARKISRS